MRVPVGAGVVWMWGGTLASPWEAEASFTRKVYYVRKEGYLYVRYNVEQAESFRSLERIG